MSFTAFMIESDDFDGNQEKYGMDVDSASGKNIGNLEIISFAENKKETLHKACLTALHAICRKI